MGGFPDQTLNPYYPFWPYFGWQDLGPVQVPPMIPAFGLTDATTGAVMYPVVDPAQGNRLAVVSSPPIASSSVKIYPAGDGPFFGASGYKLILDNGHLAFLDQQPDSGPMPIVPVLGTAVYGAILTITNRQLSLIAGGINPQYRYAGYPSGVQRGFDHIDFYFASLKGPIYRCSTPNFNAGSNQPAS